MNQLTTFKTGKKAFFSISSFDLSSNISSITYSLDFPNLKDFQVGESSFQQITGGLSIASIIYSSFFNSIYLIFPLLLLRMTHSLKLVMYILQVFYNILFCHTRSSFIVKSLFWC